MKTFQKITNIFKRLLEALCSCSRVYEVYSDFNAYVDFRNMTEEGFGNSLEISETALIFTEVCRTFQKLTTNFKHCLDIYI